MQTSDQTSRQSFTDLTSRLPLLWVSLAFLLGILLASQVHFPLVVWFVLAGIGLLGTLAVQFLSPRIDRQGWRLSSSTFFLAGLALTVGFLGAARYQSTIPKIDAFQVAWYNDRQYELLVTGTLAAPPDARDTYTNLRLRVEAVDTGDGDLPVEGLLLARIDPGQKFHYGDRVRLRGLLKTPPENEDFSYRDYLARQGIHAYMPTAEATLLPGQGGNPILRAIYAFKNHALQNIYRIFPDPEAALLGGILLGVDTGLTADLQQAYKKTGTAHIIAISGFNIAIIAGLFVTVFSRLFGPRRGAVAAVIGIAAYTLLVGAEPSVLRAAIMGGLALFARQIGRRQTAINTLTFTAAVMSVINPHTLWDVGFQLSFAATLGLILYAAPFQEWFIGLLSRRVPEEKARRIAGPVGEYLLFTLAAQLMTLPVMAYYFGRISLVALIANPFILPVQPAVMLLGGLALLLSLIYLPLGKLAAYLAWPFVAYTNRMVELFARLPHGVIVLGDFSFLFVVLFYAVLLTWTFAAGRMKQALRAAAGPAVILSTLSIFTFLTWQAAFAAPDGRLHITFLDAGSAEAVLIQTPAGHTVLINGGSSPSLLSEALGRRLSPFDRRLDWLVIGSTQEEQVGALPRTLDRFPPEAVLWSGMMESSYSARQVDEWLAGNSLPVPYAASGMSLDLGKGASLRVLTTGPRGAVLLVEWGGFRLLLPVGANFDSLSELDNGADVGEVTVLLLAEAGYAPLNPPEWIAALRPQVAVLSVAAGDINGLPDQSVLDSLQGITLLRTDRNGWIEVSTDGERMWVEVERK